MKKTFLLSLSSMMILSSCALVPITSNNPSENISGDITSESTSTSNSNSGTSEDVSTTQVPSTSEDISTSESSEENSISIEIPPQETFIDEQYVSQHHYDEAGYDIEEFVPTSDPYYSIDTEAEREAFHESGYTRASSYEDAMYRTNRYLLSGDTSDTPSSANYAINHLPNRRLRDLANYRIDEGQYEYNPDQSFRSYTINQLDGKVKKIYYGAAYITLEDVAAYVFAFADAPANWKASKSSSVYEWGIYERSNNTYFSADTDQYKFEPDVPRTDFNGRYEGEGIYQYYEMDFGYTQTGWTLGYTTYNEVYNNGYSITRGPVRLVYTAMDTDDNRGAKYIPMDHRHVFLTYNHYNDFIEYLNYENGWGIPFGWMSAGNEYCGGMYSSSYGLGYYDFVDPAPKTTYEDHPLHRVDYQDAQLLYGMINA